MEVFTFALSYNALKFPLAVAGGPMIPVHIMTPTSAVMVPSVQVISKPPIHKKEMLRAKNNDENSGPTTTVFVGNISEKASDMLIRQLLAVRNSKAFTDISCTYVTQ